MCEHNACLLDGLLAIVSKRIGGLAEIEVCLLEVSPLQYSQERPHNRVEVFVPEVRVVVSHESCADRVSAEQERHVISVSDF